MKNVTGPAFTKASPFAKASGDRSADKDPSGVTRKERRKLR